MMTKNLHKHIIFYILENIVLGIGFASLLLFQLEFVSKLVILVIMLGVYVILGLLHHKMNNDIKGRVVLEYILMSAIIFALFLYINTSKI